MQNAKFPAKSSVFVCAYSQPKSTNTTSQNILTHARYILAGHLPTSTPPPYRHIAVAVSSPLSASQIVQW